MTVVQGIYYALGALALFVFLSFTVLVLTWVERKALARIQMRMGPMRVGFHGTLQPLADAIKLVLKEDILPSWADRRVYWLAPLAVFIPSLLLWVAIPVGRDLALANLELGLLYIVAISVLSVMGLVMAGWGSANKYAMLGGLRAAGQLVSYEIPFIMAVLAVAMLVQSLNLETIVDGQRDFAYILVQPLGLFIFLTAGLAELGRTPFDIHHAESEVVGGPFIEYSGAHWAVFFLAEYINTFTIAALTVLLFLGGWQWPAMPFEGVAHSTLSVIWFLAKTYAVILFIFWIRGTYPRLRIDQLMAFGWKIALPLAFANIILTACLVALDSPWWVFCLAGLAAIFVIDRIATMLRRSTLRAA
ncbi:MAG: NADH-quinone oxidoreductase subunit NuoH [Acidimicrobiia bacterium]